MFFTPAPHYVVPTTMIDVINHLGLEASLQWVVDAGDINSVSVGTNQTLGTLPAGGSTFTLGPTTGVDAATDPVYVGTPGRQSSGEAWSTRGLVPSNFQRLETPKATWSNNAHKHNALFTWAGWVYIPSTFDGIVLFSTNFTSSSIRIGIAIGMSSSGFSPANCFDFLVANGSSVAYSRAAFATLLPVPRNVPVFLAVSQNEASGNAIMAVNAGQQTVASTYSAPSAASSYYNPTISCHSHGPESGSISGYVYNAAWWNRALSGAELTSLYNATKVKFGH